MQSLSRRLEAHLTVTAAAAAAVSWFLWDTTVPLKPVVVVEQPDRIRNLRDPQTVGRQGKAHLLQNNNGLPSAPPPPPAVVVPSPGKLRLLRQEIQYSLFTPSMTQCTTTPRSTTQKEEEQRPRGSSHESQHQQQQQQHDKDESTKKEPPTPSTVRRFMAWLHLRALPLPRILHKGDSSIFNDADLKRGLRRRQKDEEKLLSLQEEAVQARNSGDAEQINAIFFKASEIAYGKGVTPQEREEFMVRYGCTAWTNESLDYLLGDDHLMGSHRGILEIGAGHGQWARAIATRYETMYAPFVPNNSKQFEAVLAFDDMTQLPLNTNVYHKHTQSSHDHFYRKVRRPKDEPNFWTKWSYRGRILLLVFPSPGSIALDAVQEYLAAWPENDTVVYVGEGRGGANGNEALFDFFENGEWVLFQVLNVQPSPGGKGFEKMYVLQRRQSPLNRRRKTLNAT